MALSKVDYNSLNVTAAASKALKWNSGADGFETGDVAGALVLLETQTASSSATLDFTDNIDSTYNEYVFKFIDIHPATNDVHFSFNGSDDDSSHSYDVTKTTTNFRAHHSEGGTSDLSYRTGGDKAQSADFQNIAAEVGNDNDQCAVGTLHLFNPSSTTFVKHFISRCNIYNASDYNRDDYVAGYFNTTADITAIQFKMSSGNIDAGVIKLYGVA